MAHNEENPEPPAALTEITRNVALARILSQGFRTAAGRLKDPDLAKKFELVASGEMSLRDLAADESFSELGSRGFDHMMRDQSLLTDEDRAEQARAVNDLTAEVLSDPTRHPILPATDLHEKDSSQTPVNPVGDVLDYLHPDPIPEDEESPFIEQVPESVAEEPKQDRRVPREWKK